MAKKKKTPAKKTSSKKEVKKPAPKKAAPAKEKKQAPQKPKALSRYNELQKILSQYGKEKEIKFGKGLFQKKVSELAKRTSKTDKEGNVTLHPLDFVRRNIHIIYEDYLDPRPELKSEFRQSFSWFYYQDTFMEYMYQGVVIRIYFSDDISSEAWEHEGYAEDVIAWFKSSGLYAHLRKHWSASPEVAKFTLEATDKSTFANYVSIMGEVSLEELERRHIEGEEPADAEKKKLENDLAIIKGKFSKITDIIKTAKQAEQKAGVADKEAERIKAETDKVKAETELEKTKVEKITRLQDLIKEFKALGMSNVEIAEQIRKLT